EERVWAIENCRAVSRRFEQALLAAGGQVVRVVPRVKAAACRLRLCGASSLGLRASDTIARCNSRVPRSRLRLNRERVAASGARALLGHVERVEDLNASRLAGELECGLIAYRDPEAEDAGDPGWPYRFETLVESEPLVADLGPDSASPAAIFFTSGSNGPAKG